MNEASPDVLRSLFLLPASGDRVDMIVDSIDTNSLTPDIDLCINMNLEDGLAASECLLRLLDSLNEPLIPYSIFESTLATSADLKMEVEHLLAHIPHSHFELIQYLVHLIKWMNNFIKSDLREIGEFL